MGKHLVFTMVLVAFLAGTGVAIAGLEDGLVCYYKLDEDSGTVAADSSPNGYDGTLFGNALEWVPGRIGGALSWGTAEAKGGVQFPTKGLSVSAATISLWGYLGDPQASRTRYFFGHTTQPAYSNRIQVYMDESTTQLDIGLGDTHARNTNIVTLKTKTWVHVVLTWDNGKFVVYVDGAQVADGTYTGLTALNDFADIGEDGNPGEDEAFDGSIDEVRLYNRALSAAEVKELSQVPAAPRIRAWGPKPADGAQNVVAPLLTWKSVDGIPLHNVYVGTSPDLTEANLVGPRQPMKLFFYAAGLQPGVTYYWRVDEIAADMKTVYPGKVWSFLAQPLTAYNPQPADGTNTVFLAPELTWLTGRDGAKEYHIYFGESLEAVTQGTAEVDKGTLTDPNFTPGPLQEATTYYWRVDEILANNSMQTGPVWNFTTCVPIDDFESYNDEVDQGTRIYETWIDGWVNNNGSRVGYANPPFAESTIVHGGLQSMPLDYNNINAPWYSEAEREFETRQDWTAGDVDTLVLYIQGKATNGAAPLYVALKDASNHTATVVHPDAAVVTARTWIEWKIPLSEFTAGGVNVAAVKKIIIGLGDKANPTAGGAGLLFIDDICLTKPAPAQP